MTTTPIKSILAVGLFLTMSTMTSTTSALLSSSGSPKVTFCSTCSTLLGQVLVGLGNVNNSPTAYSATLAIASGDVYCKNKANNAISSGQPFQALFFVSAEAVDQKGVTRNGRYLADLEIEDEDLLAVINSFVEPDISCPNRNWIPSVVIKSMTVLGQEWVDPNPAPGQTLCSLAPGDPLIIDPDSCVVTDNLKTSCVLPEPYLSNTSLALLEKSVDYVCTQICHDSSIDNCSLTNP